MILTTATQPTKTTETTEVEKVIKPVRYEGKGEDRQLMPPLKTTESITRDIWIVTTSFEGDTETHTFMSEKAANEFYKGFN